MSSPDDENKTLGLPPGARNKLLQEIEREKQLAAQRAAGQTAGPGSPAAPRPPASPSRPPAPPVVRKPTPPPPSEPSRESYETIPPVGFPRRRDLPGLGDLKQEREAQNFLQPLQPWDAGASPQPQSPSVSREPDPEAIHPGWTMAGPVSDDHPTPWDDGGQFGTAPPPTQTPVARMEPPQRPARGVPPVPVNPWAGGSAEPAAGWPASEAVEPAPPPPSARPPVEGHGPSYTVGVRPAASAPIAPARPPAGRPPIEDGGNRTIAYDRNLHGPKTALPTLQFYNTSLRRWSDLGQVRGEQLELGRSTFQDWNPNPEDLAERHVRIVVAGDRLHVQPLRSLNGVYIKLKPNRPVELPPHTRFRIGHHVLEYRPGRPLEAIDALRAEDGEVFQSRMLAPLGFIDLIGPDNDVYLSFPLTKPDDPGTRIGRGGPRCDLALTGDDWASSEHARVYYSAGKCWLEDLKSTNGTFLQINETVQIQCGNAMKPDSGDIVVIGGYMIRVVEENL
jgi:pSer/pThr/pTyr-binding forkhead associated (FHA) protein